MRKQILLGTISVGATVCIQRLYSALRSGTDAVGYQNTCTVRGKSS